MPAPEKLTQMERQAIIDARRPLWDVAKELGLQDTFVNLSPEQYDVFIYSVWLAVRTSMIQQSASGEIPF